LCIIGVIAGDKRVSKVYHKISYLEKKSHLFLRNAFILFLAIKLDIASSDDLIFML
jgi:hypothetical protein